MPNMSYCRFENTLSNLRECLAHMDDKVSDSEQRAREKLIALCQEIAIDFGIDDDADDD